MKTEEKNLIMKNVSVDYNTNEYIIFNVKNQTQSKIATTVKEIGEIVDKFKLTCISPIQAKFSGYFNFKHVVL